jgi:uncharacterized protein (TIGR02680 family)
MSLPVPLRERWQPLRIGLSDLFYYDHEEFAFRDGRLLLRGNNGTGKSKVLALTLPFLLDGELSPHRVEPDADPKKRMEWNLLLGGEHPHPERLGYSWMEFGRLGAEGPEFCTIGCGMKAVQGRGITAHWFFVTERRIGSDLALVDHTGVALGADRLSEALGARGSVHRTKREYRRAIDERLFGLGEQRYGALIDLLIKIRQPQLSKRPDERSLSAALTDALAPLDQALLHNVAEAFRALEDDAVELQGMEETRDASSRYLATYRTYARMATRLRAKPLRQTQTTFDRLSRELSDAEQQHSEAVRELAAAREQLTALRTEHVKLSGRQDALRADPLTNSAQELRRAGQDADTAARQLADVHSALERLAAQLTVRRDRLTAAEAELVDATAAREEIRERAAGDARDARIGESFSDALATRDPADLTSVVRALTARQRTSLARVQTLLDRCETAQRELAAARQGTEQRESELAGAAERRDGVQLRLGDRSQTYVQDLRAHLRDATELELGDPAAAFAALEPWLETLSGANPAEQAIVDAGQQAVRRLARAETEADARADAVRAAIAELERERTELESGLQPQPATPPTRASDVRTGRPGAPLWQLIDFSAEVDAGQRAGIEAALEASGILDAWVTPAGELVDAHTEDTLLSSADLRGDGPGLGDVLTPVIADGAEVEVSHVTHLLSAIGLGESDGTVWVADDGRYRNGALRGAWHKPTAQFVGHAAREAARQARIAELTATLGLSRNELGVIETELATLASRREALNRELNERPSDSDVRDAHTQLGAVEAEVAEAERRLEAARQAEARALTALEATQQTLRSDAADLGLPSEREHLEAIARSLARFELAVETLWPAFARAALAQKARTQAQADVDEAEQERGGTERTLADLERQLASARERRDTLQATAGAAIQELEARLRDVSEALRHNADAQAGTETRVSEAQRAEGAAENHRGELGRQIAGATDARLSAVEGLQRFSQTGLITVALDEVELPEEWNVTQALRLAREIEQALADESDDDARWQRLQRQVSDQLGELADALRRHGNDAAMFPREEGIVVEITFQGQTKTLAELVSGLTEEVDARRRLLDTREREILENHLVGEVASALGELIVAAEQRVRDTNAELAERPTSTGMQLRLRWSADPDAPDGLNDARSRLLRQSADAWSEDDRAAVGGFLQRQIRAVRAGDETGTWLERLTRAFDYRHWHRFSVERRQAGTWQSASGPSSGGERVLAASVPLFAAASSYYSSAGNPHAPRLVMLDEAFAGVDDRARAKCLGLLAAFDLDVVMTSEREWGCYAEVPGLAIAQLSRIDGVAAVLVTRWEWDGAERTRAADPPQAAARAVASVTTPDGTQLWGRSIPSD